MAPASTGWPPVTRTRVFPRGRRGGSPCPVVDGTRLTQAAMQNLAARFGVETAFLCSPPEADAALRLRFFVPRHEMEMCVHGTVAALSVVRRARPSLPTQLPVETGVGVVKTDAAGGAIRVWLGQPVVDVEPTDPSTVARALGIDEESLDLRIGPLVSVSVARSKLMVPVLTEALKAARPDYEALWALCDRTGSTGLYVFSLRNEQQVQARHFPVRAGYLEDPATGVAAGALAAYLALCQPAGRGHSSDLEIWQGDALGQPCTMHARVREMAGGEWAVSVGGGAILES